MITQRIGVALTAAIAILLAILLSSCQHTVEDFNDIVTIVDKGFSDSSGDMGVINLNDIPYGQTSLECEDPESCALRLLWSFTITEEVGFTGVFISIFGLTGTLVTYDGETKEMVYFPEHNLDIDNIDGSINYYEDTRKYLNLCAEVTYSGNEDLKLRVELKDSNGGFRFTRIGITGSSDPQKICWNFRDQYRTLWPWPDLDIHKAKELVFIIERWHIGDRVWNPDQGQIDIHRIWFNSSHAEVQSEDDQELLNLAELRAYQYCNDWSSRKPTSLWIPQDRSTFGDLLTVGGIGFCLPGHIIAAEQGWIDRSEAAQRVVAVLRILDNPSAFCQDPIGCIGYQGLFYHFLDLLAGRKIDISDLTPRVEVSIIDTSLALMGILDAQSYFNGNNLVEAEIRIRAQRIYDRVNWVFILEPNSGQFYWAWVPEERPGYQIPAPGGGFFSGTPGNPATIDLYTDEALIISILAVGSKTHPVPVSVYCAWERRPDETGFIPTWTGALFTFQFLHAFLDTRSLDLPACPGEEPVDWYENSQQAMLRAIEYATQNPLGLKTYGSCAWGISAAEGPDDRYRAYGAPPLRINPDPRIDREDGTITYYAMISAVSFGDNLRNKAIEALRCAWERDHWHSRFGLPDVFNDEIGQVALEPVPENEILREEGPWVNRALFAINQGPMLLHLANARSRIVWNLSANNPNIQYALERLGGEDLATPTPTPVPIPTPTPTITPTAMFPPTPVPTSTPTPTLTPTPIPTPPAQILLEGEDGTGDGQVMPRSRASNLHTVWLHTGESRILQFELSTDVSYSLSVRYSNDNFGPLETVEVSVDGVLVGTFAAQDTGNFGNGWNVFESSGPIGSVELEPGNHEVVITVSGGDGYGVEIDVVTLDRVE